MRRILPVLAIVTLFALPAKAELPASPTVEGALQSYFAPSSEEPAAAVLSESGLSYERMLTAEVLPGGSSLFVEVELRRDGLGLRYPLKLKREKGDGGAWRVEWAPAEEYARGLVALGDTTMLASMASEEAWARIERLPSLPVLVSDQILVTPFGPISESATPGPRTTDDLAPPEELVEHTQRWAGLVLKDDPGPAGVDLILARNTTWRRLMQALMAPAAAGLYRAYLVGQAEGQLVASSSIAPVVGGDLPEGVEPLIVGMYPAAGERAFRVRIGERIIEGVEACEEGMTRCVNSPQELEDELADPIRGELGERPVKIGYVMFAATGDTSAALVASYLPALAAAIGVASDKVVIGLIGDEDPTDSPRPDAEESP